MNDHDVIRFACPKCGRQLRAKQPQAGKRIRCPDVACKAVFAVPNATAVQEAPPNPIVPRNARLWWAAGVGTVLLGVGAVLLAFGGRGATPNPAPDATPPAIVESNKDGSTLPSSNDTAPAPTPVASAPDDKTPPVEKPMVAAEPPVAPVAAPPKELGTTAITEAALVDYLASRLTLDMLLKEDRISKLRGLRPDAIAALAGMEFMTLEEKASWGLSLLNEDQQTELGKSQRQLRLARAAISANLELAKAYLSLRESELKLGAKEGYSKELESKRTLSATLTPALAKRIQIEAAAKELQELGATYQKSRSEVQKAIQEAPALVQVLIEGERAVDQAANDDLRAAYQSVRKALGKVDATANSTDPFVERWTAELILEGYLAGSLKAWMMDALARQLDVPLERRLAWGLLASTGYRERVSDEPAEYRRGLGVKLEIEVTRLKAQLDRKGYFASYVESKILDLQARQSVDGLQAARAEAEIRANDAVTPAIAANIVLVEAWLKEATTKDALELRNRLKDAMRQALKDNPKANETLEAANALEKKTTTENLRQSRARVGRLFAEAKCKHQIRIIQYVAETYRIGNNVRPPSLKALIDKKLATPELLMDPWNQSFQYDPAGKRNGGRRPDIWTVTPEKVIIGNWPEGASIDKNQTAPVPTTSANGPVKWQTTERLVLDAETAAKAHRDSKDRPADIWVSSDGKRVAYRVKDQEGETMVVDGKPGKRYKKCRPLDLYSGTLFFANGARCLYVGEHDKFQTVVVDGVEQGKYDMVAFTSGESYLHADDVNYAYVAGIRNPKLVVNGKESFTPKLFWGVRGARPFILLGQQAAWTETDSKEPFEEKVFVNGALVTLPKGTTAVPSTLILHGSGAFGFLARKDKDYHFVVKGKLSPAYVETGFFLRFSADGKHHAYAARGANGKWKVVLDGREQELPGKPYVSLHLCDDGSHWAMQAEIGEKQRAIVHDGKIVGQLHESFNGPILSPDGKHVMAVATVGGLGSDNYFEQAVVDGVEHAKYHRVANATFSADGRVAYVAMRSAKGKSVVVVDGKEEKEYGDIPISFSTFQTGTLNWGDDGRTLSYIARDTDRADPKAPVYRGRLVINGQERATYDQIAPPRNPKLVVRTNALSYVAVKNGAYYWVEERRLAGGAK